MMEKWKDIKGYEGYYQISNKGRVKSLNRIVYKKNGRKHTWKERILNHYISKTGYCFIKLRVNNEVSGFSIHRLVLSHFTKNIKNKPCINHKDGDKLNNISSNLEWCTYSENHKHAYKLGLMKPAMKGRTGYLSSTGCEVHQFSLDNQYIKSYGSVRQASLSLKLSPMAIINCLNGKTRISGGFKWIRKRN